ncbi:hypothetical protein GGE07_006568 [Sinorhizobium terangae]|nr:hypothetical protein [Sinorhizobium terangae]
MIGSSQGFGVPENVHGFAQPEYEGNRNEGALA